MSNDRPTYEEQIHAAYNLAKRGNNAEAMAYYDMVAKASASVSINLYITHHAKPQRVF